MVLTFWVLFFLCMSTFGTKRLWFFHERLSQITDNRDQNWEKNVGKRKERRDLLICLICFWGVFDPSMDLFWVFCPHTAIGTPLKDTHVSIALDQCVLVPSVRPMHLVGVHGLEEFYWGSRTCLCLVS